MVGRNEWQERARKVKKKNGRKEGMRGEGGGGEWSYEGVTGEGGGGE